MLVAGTRIVQPCSLAYAAVAASPAATRMMPRMLDMQQRLGEELRGGPPW
jgi:hypothetical protein